MRRRSFFLVLLLLAVMVGGCNRYVGRAKRAYNDGRYLEASEKLGERESEIDDLAPRQQADYGIYRGLSLMMLGDLNGAHQWLSFAYEVEKVNPGALKPEQRAILDRGWWQLAQARGGPRIPVPTGATILVPGPAPAPAVVDPTNQGLQAPSP